MDLKFISNIQPSVCNHQNDLYSYAASSHAHACDQIDFGYSLDILVYFCCWTYLIGIKTIKKKCFLCFWDGTHSQRQKGKKAFGRTAPHSVELCPHYIITPNCALTTIMLVIKFQINFRTEIIILSWGNFKNSQSSANMQ